jgi:hypothetical protein
MCLYFPLFFDNFLFILNQICTKLSIKFVLKLKTLIGNYWCEDNIMASYDFIRLADDLIFVRWNKIATEKDAQAYLSDLTSSIENATDKIYFFSDLRKGYITSTRVLREMGRLTAHPHWGGGIAIVEALTTEVFVRLFGRFVEPEMTEFIFDDVHKACARLERWKKGITEPYDWDGFIENNVINRKAVVEVESAGVAVKEPTEAEKPQETEPPKPETPDAEPTV